MNQEIFEWLLLLGRWLHITTGITWIGTSIFFMWLDRSFEFNPQSKHEGHVGDLWMVHGGGFYHVNKLLMGPTKVPDHLHWFKWESYWTWMSGIFLLVAIFYVGNGTFLLDSSVSQITFMQAIALSVASVVGSWLFYDLLWESKITKSKPKVGHVLTLLWVAGMSYLLCKTLSGRAAYIHIGAMLGTWMTANVFLRIIPRQVKMVEASKKGEPVNQDWGKNAKNRSTHNSYFTLPVIFIMLSNHFPFTYGHKLNWLLLLLISAAGAAIRHYFIIRLQNPSRAKLFGVIGILLIVATMYLSTSKRSYEITPPPVTETTMIEGPRSSVRGIVKFEGTPPAGKKLTVPLPCLEGLSGDLVSDEVLVKDARLQNVLIRITRGLEGKSFGDIPTEPVKLDQKNCMYRPHVIAARVGQKVDIINSDPLLHNVRTVADKNETFNEIMPKKDDHLIKVFNKPEIFLQTKCDIHPWMSAYIAVVEHPFFSVTSENGEFLIKDLPVGNYTLEAWHEVFGTQTKEISVTENDLNLEFIFKN